MESSSSYMACLLKIESPKPGWKKSLEKLLKTINDLSFMIDKKSKTVYVSGQFDPQLILETITNGGNNVVIVWRSDDERNKQPEKLEKPENQKNHLMEQCYTSGNMNGPNDFLNYYQNQCLYPPPNHWMNQTQPYNHFFAPPPPYTRQLHPQPPAPPPYEFHQKVPAAKSFPATPPPPKNFVMGDLQCRIM